MASLVTLPIANEPGALAKITTVLADGGIAIDGVTVAPKGIAGEATFLVKDGSRALKVLHDAGFNGKMTEPLDVTLSNHQGALADLCVRLSRAGINIEVLFGTTYGTAGTIAMLTDDNAEARRVLDALSEP